MAKKIWATGTFGLNSFNSTQILWKKIVLFNSSGNLLLLLSLYLPQDFFLN